MSHICADCGKAVDGYLTTKSYSTAVGYIYKGDGICEMCLEIREVEKRQEQDKERREKIGV